MYRNTVIEVRWIVPTTYSARSMRKEFATVEDAKAFKHEQAERHPEYSYRVYTITTEEVA